jgi:FtsX-like permease family
VTELASAWYRFRSTLGRRWPGYLTIVLLIGLLGGVALGAVGAARRTQAAFSVFLASTNPSNLSLPTSGWEPGQPNAAGSSLQGEQLVAHLPLVARVADSYNLNAQPILADDYLIPPPKGAKALGISILNNFGSLDGEYLDVDRATVVAGRRPTRADEVDLSPIVAEVLGLHVGGSLLMGFYTNQQTTLPGYGTSQNFHVTPHRILRMKVVGLAELNSNVLVDSLEATSTADILYSPALVHQLVSCCVTSVTTYLRLAHGNADVGRVAEEIDAAAERQGFPPPLLGVAPDDAAAELTIRPESLALGAFGVIAALATLLIAGLAIARQLRLRRGELRTLQALGANRVATVLDGVIGIVLAVIGGAALAAGVAIALSPLSPVGLVRAVYPDRGLSVDGWVLLLGCGGLVVLLSSFAVLAADRGRQHRTHARGKRRSPALVRAAANLGLSAPVVEGTRLAVDSGGEEAVPALSTIVGAFVALVVLVATVTFGASLDALVSHPNLYGWNWDYELTGGGGIAPVPGILAARLLDHDEAVSSWSPALFGGQAAIDGQQVPYIGQPPGASVSVPILSGHGLTASNEIVLGGQTLGMLHKTVGDTVRLQIGSRSEVLRIVGTATMPVVGIQVGATHPSMGVGALVASSLVPVQNSNANDVHPLGPSAIFVRLHSADPAGRAGLLRIARELSLPTNYGVTLLGVQQPAEILNYRLATALPALLGVGLAAGATAALLLTLLASVRRRRRHLALLRAFGFTRTQLALTVASQASVAVGIGTVLGVPIGIVIGRTLWTAFANQIDVVAAPLVPALTVGAIAVGALVLANVVAAVPGRLAADSPTAVLLRAE